MIAHLRKWIGLYLIGLLSLAIIFDDPNDDYGIGVWIFAIILVAKYLDIIENFAKLLKLILKQK